MGQKPRKNTRKKRQKLSKKSAKNFGKAQFLLFEGAQIIKTYPRKLHLCTHCLPLEEELKRLQQMCV